MNLLLKLITSKNGRSLSFFEAVGMPIVMISRAHIQCERPRTYSTYYSKLPTFRRNQINRKREYSICPYFFTSVSDGRENLAAGL